MAFLVLTVFQTGVGSPVTRSFGGQVPMEESIIHESGLILEEWLTVSFLGAKIGYVHTVIKEIKEGGHLLETRAVMKLKVAEEIQITSLSEEAFFDEKMELKGFYYRQTIGNQGLEVTGKPAAGGLELKTRPTGGEEKTTILEREEPIFPISSLGLILFHRGVQEGKKYKLSALLEPLLTVVPVEITVGPMESVDLNGEKKEGFRITAAYGGFTSTSWVEESGLTIKEVSAEGFESFRVTEEEALSFDAEGLVTAERFLMATRIRSDRPLEDFQLITGMTVRLEGFPTGFFPPEGAFQRVVEQQEYLDNAGIPRNRISLEILKPSPLGVNGRGGGRDHMGYLQDHPFLQCSHDSIARLASELTGEPEGNWEKASAVKKWVHGNLKKEMVDSFSALQALESGGGECQAHANLMTAICRAAGIPARVVAGIVWTDQWQGFFYHAWVEIWDEGTWYPMDPTLGRETATHIKLMDDGWSDQWRLIGVIARLKISVTETSY
jgi:hypothetical protein